MPRWQHRSFTEPEEARNFPHGQLRVITLDEVVVGRYALQPGWRWSNDIKPIVGTPHCQHHHMGYSLQGRLHVVLKDGTAYDVLAGEAYEIPPGHDAWVVGDEEYVGIEFSGSRLFAVPPDSMEGGVVATLLFTDIVGSTAMLARVGDAAWREMLLAHNAALRAEIERFRGRELKTTGDGFLASFDSASRAVRCGLAMGAASRAVGLDIRVGIHTGEVELLHGDARGVAVHAAARVMSLAGTGEVFVSWTTRDLLAGSGISVESAGSHELKGLDGAREVFRVL
ncbi:MAG TPA: adenylate/guanylate cyclase domain-containing protein [Polyangiaceae bacterium]